MATIITHGLVAGALSTVAPKDLPRARLAVVLAILAMLPDIDVLGLSYGISYGHPFGHRGFTHSILFALVAGLVTPTVAFRTVRAFSNRWWIVTGLAFVATISHGIMDAFTDAGLGIGFLIPFDDTRYFAPWRPLATSPLSIWGFLNGPAIPILVSELKWIGLPVSGVLGAWHLVRWVRSRLYGI